MLQKNVKKNNYRTSLENENYLLEKVRTIMQVQRNDTKNIQEEKK